MSSTATKAIKASGPEKGDFSLRPATMLYRNANETRIARDNTCFLQVVAGTSSISRQPSRSSIRFNPRSVGILGELSHLSQDPGVVEGNVIGLDLLPRCELSEN